MVPVGKAQPKWLLVVLLLGSAATVYFLLSRLEYVMPFSQIPAVLCLPSCSDIESIHPAIATEDYLNTNRPLADLISAEIPEEIQKEKVSLLIEKGEYRVTVFYELQPIKAYDSVFGTEPEGDKRREGDRKTPEGVFRVRDLYPHEQWSKFIWLDYPTPHSWRKHLKAKMQGEVGLLSTVGSEVGIHGVSSGAESLIEQRTDWTWGCISLKNADVDEIYEVVTQGTVVEIVP